MLWCCVLQVKYRAATVNANEIANNVLSCLVAISSSCPILQYWQASLVGSESMCGLHIIQLYRVFYVQ